MTARFPVRSKAEAKKVADRIFETYGRGELPVDVDGIAKALKIHVFKERAPADLSGALVVKNGKALALVNSTHPPARQRFSLAHEIGHYLMHHTEGDVLKRDERSARGTDPEEIQANAFAAALLMPESEVRKRAEGFDLTPLDEERIDVLASDFGVSTQAMTIRLQDLGLLRLDTFW
jgi:Zn-dependent peptidase ImmA (M78 family)